MNSIQRIYRNRTKYPTRKLANFTSEYVAALPNLTVGRPYPILNVKKQSNASGWETLLHLGRQANRDVYVEVPDMYEDQFSSKVIEEINNNFFFSCI